MQVKFKKLHPRAKLPSYATQGDAGLDLVAADVEWDASGEICIISTGLSVEIPDWYVGLVFPRSSISSTDLTLGNCVGVIDSGYRGEIKLKFRLLTEKPSIIYMVGDKVGQLVIIPYPEITPEFVDELSDTERGTGGFGSTGK